MPMHFIREKGTALLSAVLIVALVSVVATRLLLQERGFVATVQVVEEADAATALLEGMNLWAAETIQNHFQKSTTSAAVFSALPRAVLPPSTLHGFTIHGELQSAWAFFNINAVSKNPEVWSRFQNLLRALQLAPDEEQAGVFTRQIAMWMLESKDDFYLQQTPPYRSGHRWFAHPSELRAVQGATAKKTMTLLPFLVALPTADLHVNPRAMDPKQPVVLAAVLGISMEKAAALIACSAEMAEVEYNGTSLAARCLQPLGLGSLDPQLFMVDNIFYKVRGEAIKGKVRYAFSSLVAVEHFLKDNRPVTKVVTLWQHFE